MNPITLADLLNSSVLVTGALLVSTGSCTIAENRISIGVSIQTSTSGKALLPIIQLCSILCCCDHLQLQLYFEIATSQKLNRQHLHWQLHFSWQSPP